MKLPVTPKPVPTSTTEFPLDNTDKLFGIVYITITGVIGTIILAVGPCFWVGKLIPYLIKLASILWWALPTKPVACVFPEKMGQQPKPTDAENIPGVRGRAVSRPPVTAPRAKRMMVGESQEVWPRSLLLGQNREI
ncbi:hypothetical protein DSO57_1037943 [Entomophthora muscae]|uniref:Uncharacterized protein n=1 Tax=Entomophthora muscae TaxID=34485 RepID=A0ACC2S0Z1_9FUNG|nr:hypothetical protein DSO57_1037943 [Entomophthora muscae]